MQKIYIYVYIFFYITHFGLCYIYVVKKREGKKFAK